MKCVDIFFQHSPCSHSYSQFYSCYLFSLTSYFCCLQSTNENAIIVKVGFEQVIKRKILSKKRKKERYEIMKYFVLMMIKKYINMKPFLLENPKSQLFFLFLLLINKCLSSSVCKEATFFSFSFFSSHNV